MPKKKIVLEFIFDEKYDEEFDYYPLELMKIRLGEGTTLTEDERDAIAEGWGQSDFWHVDIHNDILDVIDSGHSVNYTD